MTRPTIGRLIGVSLGPGDPGLITRRAWKTLQSGAHWTYPVRHQGADSYALDIVRRAGLALPVAHTPLVFPMTHDPDLLAIHWQLAATTVRDLLASGRDVAFLVEGDASTYATFGYLARAVRTLDPEITVETIAGVPSYHAAAARLGDPLASGSERIAVLPASYGIDTIRQLLPEFDTLVLLKVKPLLDDLIACFDELGVLPHCRLLERVGTKQERIERNLALLRGRPVHYLSLILVRNPARTAAALEP